jgi:hypothetical protein
MNPLTSGNQPSLDVSPIWTLFAAEVENLRLHPVQINVKVGFMLMLHRKFINFLIVHILVVLWFHRRLPLNDERTEVLGFMSVELFK